MNQQINLLKQKLGTGSINIFGRPFAGKDTQGEKLTKLFDAKMLGGGDIIRNSVIPPEIKKIQDSGALVPSENYVDIVLPYLSKPEFKSHPLILSSVGRWIGEELGVINALEAANHSLKAVIYLDIDEKTVTERWNLREKDGIRQDRADDTLEILQKRLNEYQTKTIPVIQRYAELGILIRIDGSLTADEVFEQIITELTKKLV